MGHKITHLVNVVTSQTSEVKRKKEAGYPPLHVSHTTKDKTHPNTPPLPRRVNVGTPIKHEPKNTTLTFGGGGVIVKVFE